MRPAASIRPTALGVKGVLLFVALELAFFATDYSNLFFLLLAFSSALGALGAAWSWQNLRNVRGFPCFHREPHPDADDQRSRLCPL